MPATSMIVVTTLAAHVVSTCLCPPMSGVYIYTHILTCLAMQLDASGAGPSLAMCLKMQKRAAPTSDIFG